MRFNLLLLIFFSHYIEAAGLQPFEDGAKPIYDQIELINKRIESTELKLNSNSLSDSEKLKNIRCLEKDKHEKKRLEQEIADGKAISKIPFILYLQQPDMADCS